MKGYLVLENGEIFEGERIGYNKDTCLEVVFNTSMTGYLKIFTDPSYASQGVVMTYPLIGNYGVIPEDYESDNIYAKAIFIHELAEFESNFRTKFNLEKFLRDYKIPGLTNVNTRKLTKILRDAGTMRGYITSNIDNMNEIMEKIKAYEVGKVVEEVTSKQIRVYGKGKSKKVALIDYGFKHYTIQNVNANTLDKLEKFEPNYMMSDGSILEEFGVEPVLITWMLQDGYGLTDKYEELKLDDYIAYKCRNTIYLLNWNISDLAIKELIEKYCR